MRQELVTDFLGMTFVPAPTEPVNDAIQPRADIDIVKIWPAPMVGSNAPVLINRGHLEHTHTQTSLHYSFLRCPLLQNSKDRLDHCETASQPACHTMSTCLSHPLFNQVLSYDLPLFVDYQSSVWRSEPLMAFIAAHSDLSSPVLTPNGLRAPSSCPARAFSSDGCSNRFGSTAGPLR